MTLQLTALGTRAWLADQDYLLQDIIVGLGANVVVSFNPSLTVAQMGTTTDTLFNVIGWKQSGNSAAQSVPAEKMAFPIDAGQTIYVASSAQALVFLYLDTVGDSVSIPS